MTKKLVQISSFNVLASNLYILALVTTLSLTLSSSFSFQPLCVIRLASQTLPGYVYTASRRQICTCSPYGDGWVRARCKLHAVYTWTGHHRAWMDGLWWGHQAGLRPLGSHWAQLTLAHSVGGVRVCVPPKHLVHTALAAALRESLLLCVHSSTVLQIWLHLFWAGLVTRLPKYGICTVCQSAEMHPEWQEGQLLSSSLSGLHGNDPQLLGKNIYNAVVPGELQGWPQTSQLSSMVGKHMSPQKHQHFAPGCSFAAKWALFWFST